MRSIQHVSWLFCSARPRKHIRPHFLRSVSSVMKKVDVAMDTAFKLLKMTPSLQRAPDVPISDDEWENRRQKEVERIRRRRGAGKDAEAEEAAAPEDAAEEAAEPEDAAEEAAEPEDAAEEAAEPEDAAEEAAEPEDAAEEAAKPAARREGATHSGAGAEEGATHHDGAVTAPEQRAGSPEKAPKPSSSIWWTIAYWVVLFPFALLSLALGLALVVSPRG
eukprot:GHVU01133461.1.p1 GENE.GHVU01133461.1~~GHVU01133461.1.p1  ORF type:complete len:220 (-),score=39.46 GHVU01133461.1:385-1044(-)